MNGFCVICGCGIGPESIRVTTNEGVAHEGCTQDPPDPPVRKREKL